MELLLLCAVTIMLFVCLVNKYYRRSPLMIFCGIWFTIVFFYSLKAFGVYGSSELTYSIYFWGISSFFLGYILIQKNQKFNKNYYNKDPNWRRKRKAMVLLIYLSIIITGLRALRAIPLWIYGGAGTVKLALYGDDSLEGVGIESMLYTYLAHPIQIMTIIYLTITVLQKKKDMFIVYLSIALLFLSYMASAQKALISEFIFLFSGYIICISSLSIVKNLKKYKSYLYCGCLLFILILVILSTKGDGNVYLNLYTYLCGCIPMSDIALTTITSYPHFYGLMTFNGVVRLLLIGPKLVGFGQGLASLGDAAFEFRKVFGNTNYIGPGIEYNAFISMFTDFFMDGGLLGVIGLSGIFGFIVAKIKNYTYKEPTYRSIGLLLFMVFSIWTSMVRISTQMIYNVVALVLIIILFPKNSIAQK